MTTQVEYALMAGDSYLSNRALVNQFPVPAGWTPTQHSTKPSGFEAISFYNGTSIANSTQIVISYAGTNPSSISDWVTNVRLWAGYDALQLQQAADYYLQVQALNPNATISFTGHSLGGGLASLMAVMFDKTAVTFDQPPFRTTIPGVWATECYLTAVRKSPAAASSRKPTPPGPTATATSMCTTPTLAA